MSKMYIGKENGKTAFDKSKQCYYVYWYDPETLKRKTTSYARWYWEVNRGEIPEGYRASYKDKNPLNIDPDNIVLISPEEFGNSISERLMGHTYSDETLEKMSKAKTGKSLSEEHKKNIGKATKQMWKEGVFDAPETREAYSKQGKATKGSKRTEEQKLNLSIIQKERYQNQAERDKTSEASKKVHSNPEFKEKFSSSIKKRYVNDPELKNKISSKLKGRAFTEEHLENLSIAGKNRVDLKGKNSRWWRGGTNNDPYSGQFNSYLKRKIRRRDNHSCQSCGENVYRSKHGHVHHIDGNKQNCSEDNLLLLCATCHNAVHGRNNITSPKIEELKSKLV